MKFAIRRGEMKGTICAFSWAIILSACAVASPFAIKSTGAGLSSETEVALTPPGELDGSRAEMALALREALVNRGLTIADDGRYLADYSVSVRDAEGGMTIGNLARSDEIDWAAQPRKSRVLDGCDAQRMRATLVLLDRQDGSMIYRGEGEATDCSFSAADMQAVAQQLVQDALARTDR